MSSSVEPYQNTYYFSKIFMCRLRPTRESSENSLRPMAMDQTYQVDCWWANTKISCGCFQSPGWISILGLWVQRIRLLIVGEWWPKWCCCALPRKSQPAWTYEIGGHIPMDDCWLINCVCNFLQGLPVGCGVIFNLDFWGSTTCCSSHSPNICGRKSSCSTKHGLWVDCWMHIFQNIPSLLQQLQNILWGSKG